MNEFLPQLTPAERRMLSYMQPGVGEMLVRRRSAGHGKASIQIRDADTGETIEIGETLWKLSDAELARLDEWLRTSMEADEVAQRGAYDEAVKLYRKALGLNPYDATTMMSHGIALAHEGNFREALEWGARALETDPSSERNKHNLEAIKAMASGADVTLQERAISPHAQASAPEARVCAYCLREFDRILPLQGGADVDGIILLYGQVTLQACDSCRNTACSYCLYEGKYAVATRCRTCGSDLRILGGANDPLVAPLPNDRYRRYASPDGSFSLGFPPDESRITAEARDELFRKIGLSRPRFMTSSPQDDQVSFTCGSNSGKFILEAGRFSVPSGEDGDAVDFAVRLACEGQEIETPAQAWDPREAQRAVRLTVRGTCNPTWGGSATFATDYLIKARGPLGVYAARSFLEYNPNRSLSVSEFDYDTSLDFGLLRTPLLAVHEPEHRGAEEVLSYAKAYASRDARKDAVRLASEAFDEFKRGPANEATAQALHDCGVIFEDTYDLVGKHDKAKVAFNRALAIREEIVGPNDPSIARMLAEIARRTCYSSSEAAPLFERALTILLGPGVADERELGRVADYYRAKVGYSYKDSATMKTLLKRAKPGSKASGGRCFIATAAYGTEDADDVALLRAFRDDRLRRSTAGCTTIRLYELLAPAPAQYIASNRLARWLVRRLLVAPLARVIRAIFRYDGARAIVTAHQGAANRQKEH